MRFSTNQQAPNDSANSVTRADRQQFNNPGTIFEMGYLGCECQEKRGRILEIAYLGCHC